MSIKMTLTMIQPFYLPNCARVEKGWDESKGSHFPFSSLISTSESDQEQGQGLPTHFPFVTRVKLERQAADALLREKWNFRDR